LSAKAREIAAGWVLDLLNYALRTKATAKTPAWAFTFFYQFFELQRIREESDLAKREFDYETQTKQEHLK
jgi:hypothetical protein